LVQLGPQRSRLIRDRSLAGLPILLEFRLQRHPILFEVVDVALGRGQVTFQDLANELRFRQLLTHGSQRGIDRRH
jgi:hypothetical protein